MVISTRSGRNRDPQLGSGLTMSVSTRAVMMARFCGIVHSVSHAARNASLSPTGTPLRALVRLTFPSACSPSLIAAYAAVRPAWNSARESTPAP